MREALKELIKRLLRVPPEPHPPLGAPGSMRLFRAAPGFFRYRLLGWGISQAGTLIGLIVGIMVLQAFADSLWNPLAILELLAVAFFLIQLPVSFLMIVLDYEYRWYMVTDRSLRIREGLLKVQERTMTFSNIQNVSVRQGPIQRLFGISDVEVRTAGGGGASAGGQEAQGMGDNLHQGYFRGVDNAAEIRDTILAHLRSLRTSGLGDPEEPAAEAAGPDSIDGGSIDDAPIDSDLLDASRQLLAEARALREVVAS